jgi:hypothetical protein
LKHHKTIRNFAVILIFSVSACGVAPRASHHLSDVDDRGMFCQYDGDDFNVVYFGKKYSSGADDNYSAAAVSCGTNASMPKSRR